MLFCIPPFSSIYGSNVLPALWVEEENRSVSSMPAPVRRTPLQLKEGLTFSETDIPSPSKHGDVLMWLTESIANSPLELGLLAILLPHCNLPKPDLSPPFFSPPSSPGFCVALLNPSPLLWVFVRFLESYRLLGTKLIRCECTSTQTFFPLSSHSPRGFSTSFWPTM